MPHLRSLLPALTLCLAPAVLAACTASDEGTGNGDPRPTASASSPTATTQPEPKRTQVVDLAMHPQLAQTGSTPAASRAASSTMLAKVTPRHRGGEVTLQRRSDDGWVDVATQRQDDHGEVVFAAPHARGGEPVTYRARADEDARFLAAGSRPARTDLFGAPDLDEEFDGPGLPAGWSHRLQGYSAASSRACSRATPGATTVTGGVARLSVAADPARAGATCDTPDGPEAFRINGHISTDGQRAFRYGWFAARIKFQPGRGQHGAFWMQPQSRAAETGDPRDTGAEIDVIEYFGEDQPQGGLTSFVYYRPDEKGRKVGGFIRKPGRYGSDWASTYHVFSVEWTPQKYVFRIDGRETFRTKQGVSGREQYLILSLLSSDYELRFAGRKDLPQTMSVDWVRHWKG